MMNHTLSDGKTNGHLMQLYDERSNNQFRYRSSKSLLENTDDLLKMVIEHRKHQVPRLKLLERYYLAQNVGIMTRPPRRNQHKADVRIAHGFARYITDYFVGYMFGVPANIEYDEEDDDVTVISDKIKEFNKINSVDTLNAELSTTLSKYGRAYELQYRNRNDVDKLSELSVFNTFVIYDKTTERNEVAGVYYTEDDGEYDIQLYTDNEIIYFEPVKAESTQLTIHDQKTHDYGEMNITEFTNDRDRKGDYETSIPSIDSYDYAQSDLGNFMTDSNEAKLTIIGGVEDVENISEESMARGMKDGDVLVIKPEADADGKYGDINVGYIERSYDVQGAESYKKRIENDIHKYSSTPNFNDEEYSNASSGVAIALKNYHSDHKVKTKQHLFERALRKRYRLLANFLIDQEELDGFDPRRLQITLHTNLPTSYKDEIEAHMQAGGRLSQKTLVEQLNFVKNADNELKRIKDEDDAKAKEMQEASGLYDYQIPKVDNESTSGEE